MKARLAAYALRGVRRLEHVRFPPVTRSAMYSVVFLFVLSFLLAGAAYRLSVSAVQGEIRSRASIVQLCHAGNDSRAQQLTLWAHIVAVSQPPPGQTAAQQQQRRASIRAFMAYVHKVFAPRNCATRFKG